MTDIKMKDALKGTIKQIDKAAMFGDRMRTAYISTKEKAEHSVDDAGHSPDEYASDRVENAVDRGTHEAVHQFDKAGRKGVETTKQNISKAKDDVQKFKERRAEQSLREQTQAYRSISIRKGAKTAEQTESAIKQSVSSAGKQTIKSTQKTTVKTAQKSVKTAEKTAKTTIKTTQQSAKATQRATQATMKASQKAAQASKATAKAVATGVKTAVKATIAAIKALVSAIVGGGWVAVIVIIVICLIAAVAGSFYGIFFSGEDSGNGYTIKSAITEINEEYNNKIDDIKANCQYDQCEINGNQANWKDVLAIYSVKTTTDATNPIEVATIDDNKKAILASVFWDMNEISSKITTKTETKINDSLDDKGNSVKVEQEVQTKVLEITISSKTADEMVKKYSFSKEQKAYLTELIDDKNNTMWNSLIFNLHPSGSGIDIGSLTFENEEVNDTQKKIVSVAINSGSYGISAKSGYCQAWVSDVYQVVFGSRSSAHCALCAADSWGVSSDWSKIPVGATVYGYSNSQYGHVGIYIGNGKVAHNIGEVVVQSLDSWVEDYKGFCWGWENGNDCK